VVGKAHFDHCHEAGDDASGSRLERQTHRFGQIGHLCSQLDRQTAALAFERALAERQFEK
jgi:hypothetical protein